MALNTTTADSKARFVKVKGDPEYGGFTLVREWPHLDATRADSLMTVMNAVDSFYLNPKADSQQYSGKFVQSSLDPDADNERAITIQQTLTKFTDVTNEASLPGFKGQRARDVLNPFGIEEGNDSTVVHEYLYLNPSDSETAMGLTPTDTGTIVKREWAISERDRTGTLRVTFRNPAWTNNWAGNTLMQETDSDGYKSRTLREATGISADSSAVAFDSAKIASDSDHLVVDRILAERPDGERVVRQHAKKIFHLDNAGAAEVRQLSDRLGRKIPLAERVWENRTDSLAYLMMTEDTRPCHNNFLVPGDTVTTYRHLDLIRSNHGDGSSTIKQIGIIPDNVNSSAWPETGSTYQDSFIRRRYRSLPDKVRTFKFKRRTKYHATLNDAHNEIVDTALDYEPGTGVYTIGRQRYKSVRIQLYSDGKWQTDTGATP